MVTLAFRGYEPPKLQYSVNGYTIGGSSFSPPTYDVITFENHTEAARYCLYTCKKPSKPEEINPKKDHFNFSSWFSSSLEIGDELLSKMKDL